MGLNGTGPTDGTMRVIFASPFNGSFILVILLIGSSIPALHSQAETRVPATLTIDIEDGILINDEFTFEVVMTDEKEPRSASWELLDSTSTKQYVSVSEFGQGTSTGPSKEWTFNVEILPETIGPCSCILVVSVIGSNDIQLVEYASIFIQPLGVTNEAFTPTLHILDGGPDNWHSQSYVLEALSSTIDGNVPSFSSIIQSSTAIKCTYEWPGHENSLYAINNNATPHQIFSDIAWSGETLTFEINLSLFDDGWHDIILFGKSEIGDSSHSHDCISIRIDNTAPTVIVDVPVELPEGTENVYLDASSTFDEFWGIQGLTYTWSINKIGRSGEEMNQIFSGLNHRSIELNLVNYSVFTITLSVSDNAGNMGLSTNTLVIVNIAPKALLTINEENYYENDRITLSPGSSIFVDASSSTDTSNDIDKLRYIWRVNNVPTYEGPNRSISWPDEVDGDSFVLSIEVIDDDSESSMISILVVDSSQSGSLPVSILILIVSGCFLSYSLFRRSRSDDPEIPKWT